MHNGNIGNAIPIEIRHHKRAPTRWQDDCAAKSSITVAENYLDVCGVRKHDVCLAISIEIRYCDQGRADVYLKVREDRASKSAISVS